MKLILKKKNIEIKLCLSVKDKLKMDYETLEEKIMKCISVSGWIIAKKLNIDAGGQCQEELKEYLFSHGNELTMKEKEYLYRVYKIWEEYGNNDLTLGTKRQIDFLSNFKNLGKINYTERCKILSSEGLLIDNGYHYGNKWLCKEIPDETLKELIYIFENFETKTKGGNNG